MSNSEAFEEYVTRFCAKHGISPEEAKQQAIVKEYKSWIERNCNDDHTRQKELLKTVQEIDAEDKCTGTGTPTY